MTTRIMEKYQKQFKFLEKEFGFLKKSYFIQKDLHEQIEQLKKQIDKGYEMLEQQNQLSERNQKIIRNQIQNLDNEDFANIYYLKEIKMPVLPQNDMKSLSQIENAFVMESNNTANIERQKKLKIYPNHKISIKITFNKLQHIIDSCSLNTQSQLFPKDFTIHLHHLNNHLKSELHYDQVNGLYQTGNIIHGWNIMQKQDKNIFHAKKPKKSTKTFNLQYFFRQTNIDLYTQLFKTQQSQNLVFSISNTQDESEIAITMTKLNFNHIVFGQSLNNKLNQNSVTDQTLIDHSKQIVLYFRKLISFNQVCPIQELPLMFKLSANITVKQQIVSAPLQDFNNLFHPNIKNEKKHKNDKTSRSPSRSPRKVIDKSPSKGKNLQSRHGKSPHHKRSYIKNILNQGQPQRDEIINKFTTENGNKDTKFNKQNPLKYQDAKDKLEMKQKTKYQRIISMDRMEIRIKIKQYLPLNNSLQAHIFSGQYFTYIEDQISERHINVGDCSNIDLLNTSLKPIIDFKQTISERLGYSNDRIDQFEESYQTFKKMPLQFSIKVQVNISLKDKDNQGKIMIHLPFIQKLKKFLVRDTDKKTHIASAFEIIVEPNDLFKIEDYENIKSQESQLKMSKRETEQIRTSRGNNKRIDHLGNKTLGNKIIRLENNIYLMSESLPRVNIFRNPIVQNIQSQSIYTYQFKSLNNELLLEFPEFHVYPFGLVYEVVKRVGGGYLVLFKIQGRQYRYYANTINHNNNAQNDHSQKEVMKSQHNNSAQSSKEHIWIQIAVTAKIKEQKQASKNTTIQVEIFKARLLIHHHLNSSVSFRQIEVNDKDIFYSMEMKNLLKQEGTVNITANNQKFVHVVNGNNFKLTQYNQSLILQLMTPIQKGQSLKTLLRIDNWQKGETTLVQLKLINQQSQQPNQINQTNQINSTRNKNKDKDPFEKTHKQTLSKKFISMGSSIKKQTD